MYAPSPRRRIASLLGAVFLVTALGFVAGRASINVSRPVTVEPVPSTAVTTSPIPVASTVEGTHTVDGLLLGYTDDERGAVAAATTFARVLGGSLLLSPSAYTAAVQLIAAPDQENALTQAADQQLSALDESEQLTTFAAQGVAVSVTTVPISYQVQSFGAQQASVAVWAVGVIAVEGHTVATAAWSTVAYDLSWVPSVSDWRLDSAPLVDGGWAPAEAQPTPATSDIPGQLSQYQRYSDALG
jgi:hypothetical protein